jgi:hypothetical protein
LFFVFALSIIERDELAQDILPGLLQKREQTSLSLYIILTNRIKIDLEPNALLRRQQRRIDTPTHLNKYKRQC